MKCIVLVFTLALWFGGSGCVSLTPGQRDASTRADTTGQPADASVADGQDRVPDGSGADQHSLADTADMKLVADLANKDSLSPGDLSLPSDATQVDSQVGDSALGDLFDADDPQPDLASDSGSDASLVPDVQNGVCQSGQQQQSPCGTCGTRTRSCVAGAWGSWSGCSDPGKNACGGCQVLAHGPYYVCGTCGVYRCAGSDDTECDDPGKNACGGCQPLSAAPGSSCGTCGTVVCDGTDSVRCESVTVNRCGGCLALSNAPGTSCGSFKRWVCISDNELACLLDPHKGQTPLFEFDVNIGHTPGADYDYVSPGSSYTVSLTFTFDFSQFSTGKGWVRLLEKGPNDTDFSPVYQQSDLTAGTWIINLPRTASTTPGLHSTEYMYEIASMGFKNFAWQRARWVRSAIFTGDSSGLTRYRGSHIALNMDSGDWEALKSPSTLMMRLESGFDAMSLLVGRTPRIGNGYLNYLQRFSGPVMNYWALAGNPILLNGSDTPAMITELNEGLLPFGMLHEMGHMFDVDGHRYLYGLMQEGTANLWLVYAAERLRLPLQGHRDMLAYQYAFHMPIAREYQRDVAQTWSTTLNCTDYAICPKVADVTAGMLLILRDRLTWEPIAELLRAFTSLAPADWPSTSTERASLFVRLISTYAGRNLTRWFAQEFKFDTLPASLSGTIDSLLAARNVPRGAIIGRNQTVFEGDALSLRVTDTQNLQSGQWIQTFGQPAWIATPTQTSTTVTLPSEISEPLLSFAFRMRASNGNRSYRGTRVRVIRFERGLLASYFSDTSLTTPWFSESVATVNAAWGNGGPTGPDGVTQKDGFSVRYSGAVRIACSGTTRFHLLADDGVRLRIDGNSVIDAWNHNRFGAHKADVELSTGWHRIELEYREIDGDARVRLLWESGCQAYGVVPAAALGKPLPGLLGEYFKDDEVDFSAPSDRWRVQWWPRYEETTTQIDFDWQQTAPHASLGNDRFSARWSGYLYVDCPGLHTFTVRADDGVRLKVGGELIVDKWQPQSAANHIGVKSLARGLVPIQLDYFEGTGGALVSLKWQTECVSTPVLIPASNLYH